jgi:hypothetical protein
LRIISITLIPMAQSGNIGPEERDLAIASGFSGLYVKGLVCVTAPGGFGLCGG